MLKQTYPTIAIGADGFYHPQTEEEIIALVKKAYEEGLQVRCRGSAHSVAHAIYTDVGVGQPPIPNKVSHQYPPLSAHINIALDQYKSLIWEEEEQGIVVAEAGIHLGKAPGKASEEESFLYQIWHKRTGPCQGWALEALGGITHQTVSGFMMTGSAGGTLDYSLTDNVLAFRVVDGRGAVRWWEKGKDPEFYAMGCSLGVMGIITKIRFQLTPKYYVKGQERTTPTQLDKCQIDLFGEGTVSQPSLEDFFKQQPYARVKWWPQEGCERIVAWSAERTVGDEEGCSRRPQKLSPYHEGAADPVVADLEQLGKTIVYLLLGISNNKTAANSIDKVLDNFKKLLQKDFEEAVKEHQHQVPEAVYLLLSNLVKFGINQFTVVPLRAIAKYLLPQLIDLIQPLSEDKRGVKTFEDVYYNSLPMDNDTDEELVATDFTELWIPLQYSQQVMTILHNYYQQHRQQQSTNIEVTGAFPNEIYAGHASAYWMHQGYTDGKDIFRNGAVRIDIFWYTGEEEVPNGQGDYFDQFWRLFREHNIPYRLHWGKFIPDYDWDNWTAYYQEQLPKMKDFIQLREQRDPKNIFLSTYWKKRLYGTQEPPSEKSE